MSTKKTVKHAMKQVLLKHPKIKSYVEDHNRMATDIGILQLEKGQLEAKLRELQHRIINPKQAHEPTNPKGYVPKEVKKDGQAYRLHLTEQIYGKKHPTVKDLPKKGKFLQIGLGRQGDGKFGPDWTVVDLFDPSPVVDHNYDVQDLPKNWNNKFDLTLCNAILEHIPHPQKAIDELHRVLKPGGYAYVELPFWQQYHTGGDSTIGEQYGFGGDFWRATVEGLRVWMHEFEEISCGWANEGVVYFFGQKPKAQEEIT